MLALSGVLASSTLGWPGIFYCSGGATFIWTVFWLIFGSSSPAQCTRISVEEKQYIESAPGSSRTQLSVPWLCILRSVPVLALIVVHATQCWGFWSLLTETPTYLHDVFDFDIKTVICSEIQLQFCFRFFFSTCTSAIFRFIITFHRNTFNCSYNRMKWLLHYWCYFFPISNTQNALVSALPYLVMWLISLAVCPVSDFLINRQYISVSTGRKLFNSIGHWVPALTLIALPFMRGPFEAVALLTIGIGFNGFTYCGYILNHMDLTPNFAGSLMGLTNSLANIMSILGPLTVGYILTETPDVAVRIDNFCCHWTICKRNLYNLKCFSSLFILFVVL